MRRRARSAVLPRWVTAPTAADLFTADELARQERALGGMQRVLWMHLHVDLVDAWCRRTGVRREQVRVVCPAAAPPPGGDAGVDGPPADLLAEVKARAAATWMRGGWAY